MHAGEERPERAYTPGMMLGLIQLSLVVWLVFRCTHVALSRCAGMPKEPACDCEEFPTGVPLGSRTSRQKQRLE